MSKRILIVNDFHPSELPGAATIAHNYHKALMKKNDSRYYCGTKKTFLPQQDNEYFLGFSLPDNLLKMKVFRKVNQYFSKFFITFSFVAGVINNRPDLIWFHQIGQKFAFITIILVKFLGVKTIVTFHDFGGVKKGKLYPRHLGLSDGDVDSWVTQQLDGNLVKSKIDSHQFQTNFRKYTSKQLIRRFYIRALSSYFADQLLYISKLQQTIYVSFGFATGRVISNPIEPCNCSLVEEDPVIEKKSILFAGRAIGKGLEKIAHAVSLTDFELHLAGKIELLYRAQVYLSPEQIVFHGEVSRDELFLIIHRMDLVCVPSICFDVYPTITIEALSHGTPVLTHRTCGGVDALPPGSLYVQPYHLPIDLVELSLPKIDKFTSKNILDAMNELESMFRELE
jgi:glycosyltransferase involved in cell wall biosynthesis